MFKVDIEKLLRECSNNVYGAQTRYPNPFIDTKFKPGDFGTDEFRMYSFKIKMCPLNRVHDWTMCPYAHIGERARRRDPRQVPYTAVTCKDYRVTGGACPRGEMCEYAHGVFEYWLHPDKYRTQICNAGTKCSRPICFFAHKLDELRIEPTRIPKRAHLSVQGELGAQVRMLSTTNVARNTSINSSNIGCRLGLGVIGHHVMSKTPNPLLLLPSSSGETSTATGERSQELRLEFLDSLRMMRISDNYNNQQVQNSKVKINNDFNEDLDMPNVDWITDLLAG